MKSKQDILNAFREKFTSNDPKNVDEAGVPFLYYWKTQEVFDWLLNALIEFEEGIREEMVELGIRTARTYSLSSMVGEERKVVVPEALYRELLSQLEKEKRT